MKLKILSVTLLLSTLLLQKNNIYAQDGSLDITFGNNGIVKSNIGSPYDEISSIAIQSDGKIVVVGKSNLNTYSDITIARYLINGTLDNNFGNNGSTTFSYSSLDDYGVGIVIQNDGKMLIAGTTYDSTKGNQSAILIRYNNNGTLDNTFGNNGFVVTSINNYNNICTSIALQSDGNILLGGYTETCAGGYTQEMFVIRYQNNGTLDLTFNSNGIALSNYNAFGVKGSSIVIQSDDKIIIGGNSVSNSNVNFAITRFNTNGSLDNTFSHDGMDTIFIGGTIDYGTKVALQNDGQIVLAGYSHNGSNTDFALVRYNIHGIIDSSFGNKGIVTTDISNQNNTLLSLAIQNDNKIIAAGFSYNGHDYDFTLARYNNNGTLDNSFDSDGILTTDVEGQNDFCSTIALQADGKIVVAGSTKTQTNTDFVLIRYLNTDPSNINEHNDQTLIAEIFPNPVNNIITVKLNNQYIGYTYSIINILGKLIKRGSLSTETIIPVNDLQSGIYFLQVEGQRQQTVKFIKK